MFGSCVTLVDLTPMPDFKLVAPFEPTGDQPDGDRAPERRPGQGPAPPDAARARPARARRATLAWIIAQAQQADARAGPQQDAGRPAVRRVPRVLPGQRGRVLRQLLRLLPARGVPAPQRHLHREGLVAQRRDRPAAPRRDARPVRAARRDHRRQRLVHLRPRRAGRLRRDRPQAAGRRASTGATPSCATWSTSSTSATTRRSSRARFRVRGDTLELQPASEESSSGSSSSATRSSGSPSSTR